MSPEPLLVGDDKGKPTSIGWHASPKSTMRPFGWTQVGRGLRSMRRHFNVDLTNERSFWTLAEGRESSDGPMIHHWWSSQPDRKLRTVAQSPQNRHASCLRCLLLSMTRRIRRLGVSAQGCTLSSLAGQQVSGVTKEQALTVILTMQ